MHFPIKMYFFPRVFIPLCVLVIPRILLNNVVVFSVPNLPNDQINRQSSHIPSVNVAPTGGHDMTSDTPEIRKYKKRFNSEILCAALWGVNLLIGTENGLMLLDRSGQGKVYQLISRRRFQQMEVLEGMFIILNYTMLN